MSRIDRALRIRETRAGSPPAESPEPNTDDSSLHQYDREERGKESQPVLDAPLHESDARGEASVHRVESLQRPRPDAAPPRDRQQARRGPPVSDEDAKARLVTSTSSSASVEQYRKLAAALHEEQVRSQLKTVMVTSAVPGEGKTLTVVNVALTLSESYGRRVLVIDADMRKPSLHTGLNVENDRGLAEALREDEPLSFVPVLGGLSVLPAGTPGPTPLAALTSQRMAEILDECASRFDFVLIDTPPVGVLTDAQVLVRLTDAVLFVVGAGTTPAATVERAIAELGGPEAIFGVVLNRVEDRRIPSASYYGHYKTRS